MFMKKYKPSVAFIAFVCGFSFQVGCQGALSESDVHVNEIINGVVSTAKMLTALSVNKQIFDIISVLTSIL